MTKTDNSLKISVIIPVYNAEKYISHCLSSLINQAVDIGSIEILVIDDGSLDNSIEIVKEFQKKTPYIKIYSQENRGVSSARNRGIELARGEYLYFIDADDYLVDNGLSIIFESMGQTKVDLVCFKTILTRTYNLTTLADNFKTNDYDFNLLDGLSYIAEYGFKSEVWWYFINRKFLQSLNLNFVEGVWVEDAVFTANVLIKANTVYAAPIPIHRHVNVPNSVMTSKEPEHYKKVIYDMSSNTIEYDKIIKNLINSNENSEAIKKLEIRKQSFVFFLTIRIVKSKMSYNELNSMLNKMATVEAYPISKMFLTEYNGIHYRILRVILNNKALLYIFYRLYYFFG